MKRTQKILLMLITLLALNTITSCKKVLDVKNISAIDQGDVWSDPAAMQLLVNVIYANAEPEGFGTGYSNLGRINFAMGAMSGEGRPSYEFLGWTNGPVNGISFNVASAPFQRWSYSTIRLCNDFLTKIETLYPAQTSNAEIRNNLIGQVKFFRAFLYWRMIQIYGGVPIVDKVLNESSPELYGARNTMEECFQFVIKDLKEAGRLLPLNVGSGNRGRITRGAALGLLSRVLIYRASPMYSPTPNTQYWQEASDAAKAVLDLNVYSLNNVAFGSWFLNKDNAETIWQVEFVKGKRMHGWDASQMANIPFAVGDAVNTCPTQELVDAFPMNNGKAITDATSGFNPNDPYVNRDPRLRATVVTNGETFGGIPVYSFVSEGANVATNFKYNPNGLGMSYGTGTGYFMRKAMDESLVTATPREYNYGTGSYTNWVEMRLAEIMLYYAEAENELGRTAPAYDIIGKLRARAGIAAGTGNTYGIPLGLSKEDMRIAIQNERFIELAFENKRYWDLKRWKLAEVVLNAPTHVAVITKKNNTPLTSNGTDYTYRYEVSRHDISFPPVFQQKYYYLPIPQSQILLNPKLEQNPLWK
ncbi:MAG: RagB/SusD family nutrient uptake outer membrane protein [Sphingobacteriaceae bacterium]|nr:RagB/SusD family nutrient uptake outer membrane protein [Sphingobacteriaceae bacterium]